MQTDQRSTERQKRVHNAATLGCTDALTHFCSCEFKRWNMSPAKMRLTPLAPLTELAQLHSARNSTISPFHIDVSTLMSHQPLPGCGHGNATETFRKSVFKSQRTVRGLLLRLETSCSAILVAQLLHLLRVARNLMQNRNACTTRFSRHLWR